MALTTVACALLFLSSIAIAHPDFTYEGEYGPSHWGENYQTCVGKHQSPINIDDHIVREVSVPPLRFSGLDVARGTYLTNNGHTVMLRMNDSESAKISGGPLGSDSYVFEQLHFHWGENDTEGSEDRINNHSFAMELHIVFYKKMYGSMEAATNFSDGLAVLAYFFEVSEEDNPTYKPIVDALPRIELVDSKTELPENLIIKPIIVAKASTVNNYFTYDGSLTTPPCSEVVTWIDFKDPLTLSHEQIEAFREVDAFEGKKITHNFRPVQPLEDRVVYHNIPSDGTPRSTKPRPGQGAKSLKSNMIPGSRSGQLRIDSSLLATLAAFLFSLRSVITLPFLADVR